MQSGSPISKITAGESSARPGFALVATLTLMILLALLALGMLSLSSVSLRTSGRAIALTEARANARMALMLAIGELQKNTGADTRITAPSAIVDTASPPLTGAWRSWEGTDHDTTGRPKAPDYVKAKGSAEADGGRFLTWLVSGARAGENPKNPGGLAYSALTGDSIPLLSTGTLGANQDGGIHVPPQLVKDSGAFAWWVSGENQKARLPRPYKPDAQTAAAWSDIAKSHAVADPKPFGLDALLTDPAQADRAITAGTADLLPAAATATTKPREFFHDLSVSSSGLLTNTATGGWRKDLSLVTENWDRLTDSGLPFFRLSPNAGDTTSVEKPTPTSIRAAQSVLYPWSAYGNGGGNYTYNFHGAVASWRSLVDFATSYRTRVAPSADGNGSIPFSWSIIDDSAGNKTITDNDRYTYLHTVRTTPLIARIHWLFSHRTEEYKDGAGQPTIPRTFRLRLLVTPVVTLWNPFNATLPMPSDGFMIRLAKSPPCAIQYYKRDGITMLPGRKLMTGSPTAGKDNLVANYPDVLFGLGSMEYEFTDATALLPGETRVYSPAANDLKTATSIVLLPGYRPSGGHSAFIDFIAPTAADRLQQGDKVKMDLKFDNLININGPGSGIFLDVFHRSNKSKLYMRYLMTVSQASAQAQWPPISNTQLPTPTAGEISAWKPFFSTVFGPRLASDTSQPGKGFTQSSPLVSFTNMRPEFANPGWNHPGNSAFTYSFFPHALGGDDTLPNANNANNRGYIISGFGAAKGLSRVILNELPLRPIASLPELQGWDLRAHNPYPPFQINIIGNSDASPLIPANAVVNAGGAAATNYQHDDPYCANHVLFDDWFFSSIAPDPASFGNTITTSMENRYKQFLKGTKPLTNRSYRPILDDQSLSDSGLDARFADIIKFDGWQRVASRMEVEGMFNVNSTSVKAWRALLGHARDQVIPYRTEAGIALSGKTDHAFSRFTVASDTKAGDQGMSGAQIWSSEFTGYRVFSDELLDSLASKIVEQVRLRGPFLSLSEFVNRQLGTNEDLAVAGAIQVALNEMSKTSGDKDPYKELKDAELSHPTDPNDPKLAGAGYKFKKAAEGYSTYGMPGWIRQADVLRPIAPILSARDDTFTIRSYGDSRDKAGNILAKAWCEATVRRTRDFIDPSDAADSVDAPANEANIRFGRRYAIVSFRWLSPGEV